MLQRLRVGATPAQRHDATTARRGGSRRRRRRRTWTWRCGKAGSGSKGAGGGWWRRRRRRRRRRQRRRRKAEGEGDGDGVSHIIIQSNNTIRELVYQPKSYLCFTATFSPDGTTQEIVAKLDSSGESFFEERDGKKFYWVDQLRASHAQRAVERFASDLSRVGLTEAEWLRRLTRN